MTDDTMPLLDALQKRGGGDFMKSLAEEVLGRLMAFDVEGQIVLDPFLGSGSTLIAADKAGRVCRRVEHDPLSLDLVVRRYQEETRAEAILAGSGETFAALAHSRTADREQKI